MKRLPSSLLCLALLASACDEPEPSGDSPVSAVERKPSSLPENLRPKPPPVLPDLPPEPPAAAAAGSAPAAVSADEAYMHPDRPGPHEVKAYLSLLQALGPKLQKQFPKDRMVLLANLPFTHAKLIDARKEFVALEEAEGKVVGLSQEQRSVLKHLVERTLGMEPNRPRNLPSVESMEGMAAKLPPDKRALVEAKLREAGMKVESMNDLSSGEAAARNDFGSPAVDAVLAQGPAFRKAYPVRDELSRRLKMR
jgi:hypothetical protein